MLCFSTTVSPLRSYSAPLLHLRCSQGILARMCLLPHIDSCQEGQWEEKCESRRLLGFTDTALSKEEKRTDVVIAAAAFFRVQVRRI